MAITKKKPQELAPITAIPNVIIGSPEDIKEYLAFVKNYNLPEFYES